MSEEYDDSGAGEDAGGAGPGAPTPLYALEVCNLPSHAHVELYT